MNISYSTASGVEISGSTRQLAEFAEFLRRARGERMCFAVSDRGAYEGSLEGASASEAQYPGAALRIAVVGRDLVISGSQAALQTLADNVLFAADRPGEHLHIEPLDIPGFYIAPDSEPAVVTCTPTA